MAIWDDQKWGKSGRQTSRNHCLVVPYSYNVRPPVDSVQLVNITPITMVYGTQITIVTGAYINQLITGGPHIVSILHGIWSLAWCHVTKYFPEELLYIYIPASNMHPTQIIPTSAFVFPWLQHSGWKIRGTSMTSPISKIPKRAQLAKPWMFRYPLVSFNMANLENSKCLLNGKMWDQQTIELNGWCWLGWITRGYLVKTLGMLPTIEPWCALDLTQLGPRSGTSVRDWKSTGCQFFHRPSKTASVKFEGWNLVARHYI